MCKKACFPQIILLQYRAKPYLGFQNFGYHRKILECHFDTQKRLKKHCASLYPHITETTTMFSNDRKAQALRLQQFVCKISKFRNTAMATRCKASTKLAEVG